MDKVKKFFCEIKWESFVTSILAIAVGIVFVSVQKNVDAVVYVVGAVFTLLGTLLLLKFFLNDFLFGSYMLVLSALLLTGGMLCFFRTSWTRYYFEMMFGFLMIVEGVIKFQNGIDLMQSKIDSAWAVFVGGILSMGLGSVVLFGDFPQILVFCGIALIVEGICDLTLTVLFSSRTKRLEKRVRKLINDNFDEMTRAMNEKLAVVAEEPVIVEVKEEVVEPVKEEPKKAPAKKAPAKTTKATTAKKAPAKKTTTKKTDKKEDK